MYRTTASHLQRVLTTDNMKALTFNCWSSSAEGAAQCSHSVGHPRGLRLRPHVRSNFLLRCRRKPLTQVHRPGGTRLSVTAGALPMIDLTMLPSLPDLGELLIHLNYNECYQIQCACIFTFVVFLGDLSQHTWPAGVLWDTCVHDGVLAATTAASFNIFLLCGFVGWLLHTGRIPNETAPVLSKVCSQLYSGPVVVHMQIEEQPVICILCLMAQHALPDGMAP